MKDRGSTYTLCFIIGVPLARKSITFKCRYEFEIGGCQIKDMDID